MNPLLSEWLAMNPDDQNDAVGSQVDREHPMLKNLNDDELDNLLAQRERRLHEDGTQEQIYPLDIGQTATLLTVAEAALSFLAASRAMTHYTDFLPGEKQRNYHAAQTALASSLEITKGYAVKKLKHAKSSTAHTNTP